MSYPDLPFPDVLTCPEELEKHYGDVRKPSSAKVSNRLTAPMQRWLSYSPFFVISTGCTNGIDCSPRGDAPGQAFRIIDDQCLAIPDRRGNNRIDTLRNLLLDPRIGLLFLVPGANEALRVKGTASICVHPPLLDSFTMTDGATPATVLLIQIDSVYVQNDRAVRRSQLWLHPRPDVPGDLPDAQELSQSYPTTPQAAPNI